MNNWCCLVIFCSFFLSISFNCLAQKVILSFNEAHIDTVYAWKKHNKTSIKLKKGETYKITANGEWQDAGFPPTDANGFEGFTKPMKKGNFLKPMKKENYMMLIAKVGCKKYAIGTEKTVTPKRSGRLIFMPNDATFFFKNNSGELVVSITKQ